MSDIDRNINSQLINKNPKLIQKGNFHLAEKETNTSIELPISQTGLYYIKLNSQTEVGIVSVLVSDILADIDLVNSATNNFQTIFPVLTTNALTIIINRNDYTGEINGTYEVGVY